MHDITPDALAVAVGILVAVWFAALFLGHLIKTDRGPDDEDGRQL